MSVSKTQTISQSPFLIAETESFSNFFSESELSLRFSILVKGVIFTDFSFSSASLKEIESDVISVTCPIEKISLLQGPCLLSKFSFLSLLVFPFSSALQHYQILGLSMNIINFPIHLNNVPFD